MQFVDVKNDIAFRKIFGDENKKVILITAGAHCFQKHPTKTQTNEQRWCRFLNDHPLSFGSLTREI